MTELSFAEPIRARGSEIRVGTAGWTDKTTDCAKASSIPNGVSSAGEAPRYYASRFSMVEADTGFYAIPDCRDCRAMGRADAGDFVFNVKAHALMTGHATEVARLPR